MGEDTRGEDTNRDCRGLAVSIWWGIGRVDDTWSAIVRESVMRINRGTS